MEKMARLRGKRWQADSKTPDGGRTRPMFDTQAKAEAWEAAARVALAEGRPLPDPTAFGSEVRPGGGRLTSLGTLHDHVCRTHWAGTRGEKTQVHNSRCVVDYFGRNKDIREITSEDVAEMRAEMAATGITVSTVNRRCAALSKLLRTALDAGVLSRVPKMHMKREEQTKFRYIDKDEERVMLAFWRESGKPELADLCIFLIDTGARCYSEATSLKWEDISEGDRSVTFWETKTGRPRSVPLTARVRDAISRRRAHAGERKGPFYGIHKSRIVRWWRTLRALPGFHDVTPHTLRHTCCTRLILGGADVKRVMTWMGHTSIQTTMRYMQVRPKDLEGLLDLLE
ncbi:site-specific integrase [Paracoccus denitrificans]|uniref:tyrosine-type recombinase/integrase n=1 Tax=Paracoccus denitrificans TaxID=266 RepID=UPI001E5A4696|nr:site-specific integrase [Paracoccus denitrificans]UFS66923.1 site-specific integrase [Paracoccus denitrificans]